MLLLILLMMVHILWALIQWMLPVTKLPVAVETLLMTQSCFVLQPAIWTLLQSLLEWNLKRSLRHLQPDLSL
jgi:hypothetical protein